MSKVACLVALGTLTLLTLSPVAVQAQAPTQAPDAPASAKTWLDNRAAIEEYFKTTEIESLEVVKVGVTHPRRAKFPAGGLVQSMAFKAVPPGRTTGYWESYKSEIAAYELDKVLGLDMVPPTVQKRVKGDLGAAVLWCSPTKSFGELHGVPTPPPQYAAAWNRQLARAKMFDDLIGNMDPNLGNWLVDPAWNLILIDHTRAFVTDKKLVHTNFEHIDGMLWDKMKALTLESITPLLSPWMGKGEVKAVIERRDKLGELIDKLVAEKGDAAVMIR